MMALLQRLEKYRLPTALKLKEKVDRGEMMDKSDMTFLDQMAADAKKIKPVHGELRVCTMKPSVFQYCNHWNSV